MKKTISFLLVFCLFAFSLFSTGCGSSSGGFKFLGAVVAIAVIASSGGTANPAVFAANVRGNVASPISAAKTKVKVYKLDASADDLRGKEISTIAATLVNDKLTCTTDRLEVGDYLFEVYNSDKVFLRAILHVDGYSNDLNLNISPVTEIKTAVYKEWVANAPVTSVENFELNLTAALEKAMKKKADDYAEKLATWNPTTDTDLVGTVPVSNINVPTAIKVTVTNNPIPADLKNANWRTITEDDIVGKQFSMRYIRDTDVDVGGWAKLTSVEIGRLPFLMFGSDLRDGYYSMNMDIYSDENLESWLNPQSNEIPIPQVGWDEYLSYSCKVLPDSKIEVVNVDDEGNPIQGEKFNYDARITEYGGKTYLHIKSADDEEIYEVMPQQPYGSVR